MNHLIIRISIILLLTISALTTGCFESSGPQDSSGSNWLTCRTVDDCLVDKVVECSDDGYCLDKEGKRIDATLVGVNEEVEPDSSQKQDASDTVAQMDKDVGIEEASIPNMVDSNESGYDSCDACDNTTVGDSVINDSGLQSCATGHAEGNAEGGPGCSDRRVCVPKTRTLVINSDNVGDRPREECIVCHPYWSYEDNIGGTISYHDNELSVFFRFNTTGVSGATETHDLLDAPFGNANILLTLAPSLNNTSDRVFFQYVPENLSVLDRVELANGTLTVGFDLVIDNAKSIVSNDVCQPQDDVGDCLCYYEGLDVRVSVIVSLPYSGEL